MKRLLPLLCLLSMSSWATPHAPSNSNWPNTFSLMRSLAPLAPAPQDPTSYPLGNDLWLEARGSGDVHTMTWGLNVTASTSVTGGAGAQTIAVGTPKLCPSSATGNAACVTSAPTATGWFCPPTASCAIVVDPDTANEETLAAGSWSISSATSLSITPAKSHSQPYTIRQIGAADLDARFVGVNRQDVTDRPVTVLDRNNNPILSVPNDTGGTWPKNAFQVGNIVTGNNGTNGDFIYRQQKAASCWYILNSGNTTVLLSLCDGNAAALNFANTTNTSLTIQSPSDIPRFIGGGTGVGLRLIPSRSGTGTTGKVEICNNSTDESCGVNITPGNTATNKTVVTIGGTVRSGTASNTDLAGRITLTAGSGSYSFVNSYATAPVCIFEDQTTRSNSFTPTVTTSSISIASGTGTDVIKYICVGQN